MCVAIIVNGRKNISLTDLRSMEMHNPDGAGIGWAADGRVHWLKGLSAEEVHEWLPQLPRPLLVHFRFSTVGGKRADLCHPFPINASADLRVVGSSPSSLLIHNGHWSGWEAWKAVMHDDAEPLPEGPWSDTRLTAYMIAKFPESVSEIVQHNGGKVAILNGEGKVRRWGRWEQLKQYPDTYFSNTYWEWTPRRYTGWDGYGMSSGDYRYSTSSSLATSRADWSKVPRYKDDTYGQPVEGFTFHVSTCPGSKGYYTWDGPPKPQPVAEPEVKEEKEFGSYAEYLAWSETWREKDAQSLACAYDCQDQDTPPDEWAGETEEIDIRGACGVTPGEYAEEQTSPDHENFPWRRAGYKYARE